MTRAVASTSAQDTATAILDTAQALIQSRGYSGFSYQDISQALGITKASIHYHFPSKEGLGVAVVARYEAQFAEVLTALVNDEGRSTAELLDIYIAPYMQFADSETLICLCGALAGEVGALPETVRDRVAGFFRWHEDWLTRIIERGVARGEIRLAVAARDTATLAFGALQGALLVSRSLGDAGRFHTAASALKAQLLQPSR